MPTTALAEVDLLANTTEFKCHYYANSSSAQQYNSNYSWNDCEFVKVNEWSSEYNGRTSYAGEEITSLSNCLVTRAQDMPVAGSEMDICARNIKLYKGDVLYPLWPAGYVFYGSHDQINLNGGAIAWQDNFYTYSGTTNIRFYGYNGTTAVQLVPRSDGTILVDQYYYWFIIRFEIYGVTGSTGRYLAVDRPMLILMTEGRSIERQTDTLMSTDGATGVLSQPTQYVTTVTGKLGFVQQAGQAVSGLYDAIGNTSAASYVTFPGISWSGYEIPSQQVPLTGWLPSVIEDRVRDATTLVFLVAWLHGMKHIYDRMFMGDVDVIVSDDE